MSKLWCCKKNLDPQMDEWTLDVCNKMTSTLSSSAKWINKLKSCDNNSSNNCVQYLFIVLKSLSNSSRKWSSDISIDYFFKKKRRKSNEMMKQCIYFGANHPWRHFGTGPGVENSQRPSSFIVFAHSTNKPTRFASPFPQTMADKMRPSSSL